MVEITIFPKKLSEEFEATTDPSPPITKQFKSAHPPRRLFIQLINCGNDWGIDLSQATPAQEVNWWHEHLLAQCERMFTNGKIVLLAGVALEEDSFYDEIWRYIEECRVQPEILDKSEELLSIGNADICLEDFWPEFRIHP